MGSPVVTNENSQLVVPAINPGANTLPLEPDSSSRKGTPDYNIISPQTNREVPSSTPGRSLDKLDSQLISGLDTIGIVLLMTSHTTPQMSGNLSGNNLKRRRPVKHANYEFTLKIWITCLLQLIKMQSHSSTPGNQTHCPQIL